ncbi:hypothetical protein BX600DRAFT_535946 [Xylariales sp. PMI_506]|nr:hypothetical protein BX600DRAFT_535946 [Xylariales sp. PMI_506]
MGRQPTSGKLHILSTKYSEAEIADQVVLLLGYCHTCRKRRIKCDGQIPGCNRCTKSGRKCDGYELPLRIENYGVASQPNGAHNFIKISAATSFPLIPGRSLVSLRDRAAVNFLSYWGMNFLGPLIYENANVELGKLAQECCYALSMGLLANTTNDPDMRLKAWTSYGKQLREVSKLLNSQDPVEIAPLIGPVLILCGYQAVFNPIIILLISFILKTFVEKDRENLHHGEGLASILQHCGPAAFQTSTNLSLFEYGRVLLVGRGLMTHKRTFLEQDCWSKIPWQIQEKPSLQYLIDILTQIPGLLEDIDADLHQSEQGSGILHAHIENLKERLEQWRLEWVIQHPHAMVDVQYCNPTYKIDDPLFRYFGNSKLQYQAIELAMEIITYNAVLLWLIKLCNIFNRFGSPDNYLHSPQDLQSICYEMDLQQRLDDNCPLLLSPYQVRFFCQPAMGIIRSAAFVFEQISWSGGRTEVMLAPIGIAYKALPQFSALATWLEMELIDCEPYEGLTEFVLWNGPVF